MRLLAGILPIQAGGQNFLFVLFFTGALIVGVGIFDRRRWSCRRLCSLEPVFRSPIGGLDISGNAADEQDDAFEDVDGVAKMLLRAPELAPAADGVIIGGAYG
jgi:hypothetical protein